MVNDEKIKGLLQALKQLGGYYIWNAEGEEFVLISKKEFDAILQPTTEVQLGFEVGNETEDQPSSAMAYLDQVNQQLATQYDTSDDEMMDFDEVQEGTEDHGLRKRVRFEPIRGDLPPDLQEYLADGIRSCKLSLLLVECVLLKRKPTWASLFFVIN